MYKSVLLAVSALAGLAFAQNAVPACATSCIVLPSNCNLDPACICNDQQWISTISCCISTSCDQAGQQQALQYAQLICTPVGATLPSQASCSNSTSAASSNSGSASSSSATSSGAASSASSSASSARSSVTSAASSAASSASSAASSAAASATSAAMGHQVVAGIGGVFGAIVGAAALL